MYSYDRPLGFGPRFEVLVVHAFYLDGTVGRFHGPRPGASLGLPRRRIIPTVTFATHRNGNAARVECAAVIVGRVLRTAIGVMYPPRIGVAPTQRNPQRAQRQFLWHRIIHGPAEGLAYGVALG